MCPSIPSAPVFLRSLYNIWHVFEFKRSSGDSTFSMLIFSFAFSHPFFFSHLFCISLLIRAVGGPSSHVPPHPRRLQYSSHSADYMIENYSGVDFWKSGTVFFFFSLVQLDAWKNWETYQSVATRNTFWGEKEEVQEEKEQREREEKDVTMQSAPSAQRLRCGLAPSSQSQPDPHIAFIYLWKRGERRACDGEWEQETETGSGWQGRRGGWWCLWVDVCVRGGEEEREEQVFCVYSHRVAARNFRPHKRFTFVIFADPVPCKRLMSEMMNQNKPISQSLTQTDSQGGRRAARQTLFSEQNQTQILSGQISLSPFSLLFPFFFVFSSVVIQQQPAALFCQCHGCAGLLFWSEHSKACREKTRWSNWQSENSLNVGHIFFFQII